MNVCAYQSRQTYKYVATDASEFSSAAGFGAQLCCGQGGGVLLGHTELKKKKKKV